jgi:hypothetical protein
MRTDRFLTGILIGIGVLIVLALGLFFSRQESTDYRPEDTPEGVVHNFILAIERQEYERAYSYLAETDTKPSYAVFRSAFLQNRLDPRGAVAAAGEAEIFDNEAIVSLTVTRGQSGLFADPYRDMQSVLMVQQDGEWKIQQAPWPYWDWDWSIPQR